MMGDSKNAFAAIIKYWWILVFFALLGGITMFLLSSHNGNPSRSQSYEASRTIVIANKLSGTQNPKSVLNADKDMIRTYVSLMKNRKIVYKAGQNINNLLKEDIDWKTYTKAVRINGESNSTLVHVKAKAKSPKTAIAFVNGYTSAIAQVLPSQYKGMPTVQLMPSASSAKKIQPVYKPVSRIKLSLGGVVAGIVVGMIVSLMLSVFKKTKSLSRGN